MADQHQSESFSAVASRLILGKWLCFFDLALLHSTNLPYSVGLSREWYQNCEALDISTATKISHGVSSHNISTPWLMFCEFNAWKNKHLLPAKDTVWLALGRGVTHRTGDSTEAWNLIVFLFSPWITKKVFEQKSWILLSSCRYLSRLDLLEGLEWNLTRTHILVGKILLCLVTSLENNSCGLEHLHSLGWDTHAAVSCLPFV